MSKLRKGQSIEIQARHLTFRTYAWVPAKYIGPSSFPGYAAIRYGTDDYDAHVPLDNVRVPVTV